MKKLIIVVLISFLGVCNFVNAQTNCPFIPANAEWDTVCFNTSNDPLLLPQAHFAGKYNGAAGQSAIIPENRPTWALSIAHAALLEQGLNGSNVYPRMSFWMATVTQESQWRCDDVYPGGATWNGGLEYSPNGIVVPAVGDDGCFQIEGINNGSAYGALIQYYPLRFRKDEHPNLIGGANFETAALTKVYYDLFTSRIAEYRWDWPYKQTVETTCDPYAYEKLAASAYNAGIYGFQTAQAFMGSTSCRWTGLPATTAGYASQVGDMMSVLEQNPTYGVTTFDAANSSFLGYYNESISWSIMQDYFDAIDDLYWEIDFPGYVMPRVQSKWEEIAGSISNDINFQNLRPIINEIIFALPREDAMAPALLIDGAPVGVNGVECSGEIVPYVNIVPKGNTQYCEGLTLEIEANVQGGGGASPTYQWYKDGVLIPTAVNKTFIISEPAGSYSYSVEVCNGTACNTSECELDVVVTDCGGCGMFVGTTSTNTECKGMRAGTIDFVITGNTSNDYTIEYEGKTSIGDVNGSIQSTSTNGSINDLPDGTYNITIIDNTDNSCKAFSNVRIDFNTLVNEYVQAELNGISNCEADLLAEIIELPSPCQFMVQVGQAQLNFPAPGDSTSAQGWEQWINAIVQPSSGGAVTFQRNVFNETFPYDQFTNLQADFGRQYFTLNSGDTINLYSQLLTGVPGATQASVYKYEIFDEVDNLVYTSYSIPGTGSAGDGVDLGDVGSYIVTCPYSPPAYDFAWSPSISNQLDTDVSSEGVGSVSSTIDTEYIVTATNRSNNACFYIDTVTVPFDPTCVPMCDDPGVVTLDKTGSDDICLPISETIVVSESGTGSFEYSIDGSNWQVSSSFNLTSGGVYNVQVRDAADPTNTACIKTSGNYEIVEIDVPSAPTFSAEDTDVCAGTSGSYTINAVSGADDYTWSYTGAGATFNPISPTGSSATIDFSSTATSGDVEVTANNTCGSSTTSGISSVNVTLQPTITTGVVPVQCGGTVDLSTVFTESVGSTITYYTNSGATTVATNPVTATGTYYAKSVDGSCESLVASALVTINEVPTASLSDATLEICDDGSESATLNISISGGTPDYTVVLSNGDIVPLAGVSITTHDVSTTGTYTITSVTDDNTTCENTTTNTGSVTVNARTNMEVTNVSSSCDINDDVIITYDIVGGEPLNYSSTGISGTFSGGVFTSTPLPENVTHTFGVEDGTNCNYIMGLSETRSCSCPEEVTLALASGEPSDICDDGTTTNLEVTVSGGVSGATFELHRNGSIIGSPYTGQSDGTFLIPVSDEGTYTISNYAGGCAATISGSVQVDFIPTTVITTDPVSPLPLCEVSGNLNLSVSATGDNLSYQWRLNGVDLVNETNAALAVSGVTSTDAGDYTVEVTGTCGVEISGAATVVVNEATGTIPGFTSGVATSCENGVATFEIAPVSGTNVQYAWNTSPSLSATSTTTSQSLTFGNAPSYQITVTATGDCGVAVSNDTTVTITGSETLSFDLDTSIVCEGEVTTVSVTNLQGGGANPTFDWSATTAPNSGSSTSDLNLTGATSGATVSVTVTSNSACITGANPVTESITLVTKEPMVGTIEPECRDNSPFYQIRATISEGQLTNASNIQVTGAVGVTWSEVATGVWLSSDINESLTTSVSVTNENGCDGIQASGLIATCTCPSNVDLSSLSSVVCIGDQVTLNVTIGGSSVGPYDVTVRGPNGFEDTQTNVPGSYTLDVTDAGQYVVSSFEDKANTCGTANGEVTVTNHPQVSASIGLEGTNSNVCSNNLVERALNVTMSPTSSSYRITYFDGTSSQSVTTSDNPYVIRVNSGGTYTLSEVLDANNCPATLQGSVDITEVAVPTVSLNTIDTSICAEEGFVTFVATTGGSRVKWYKTDNPSDLGPIINEGLTYTTNEAGNYYVVSEAGGMELCANGEVARVEVIDIKVLNTTFGPNPVELGNRVTMQAEVLPSVGYTYVWKVENGEGGEAVGNTATYKTEVEGNHDIRVDVTMNTAPFCQKRDVFVGELTVFAPVLIPNVFTPNGDGEGDVWEVTGMKSFRSTVRIYNRWGNLVFESFNYDDPWDGTYNGKPSPDGVYFYFIEIIDPLYDGEKEIQGQIQILR